MKKIMFFTMVIFFIVSCTPTDNAKDIGKKVQKGEISNKIYTPPADGKINQEQMEKYIKVAKELTIEIVKMSQKVEDFKKKYNLSDDDMENVDKKGDKIKQEFESIKSNWEKIENEIYKKNNITPEEFEWIAAALTDSVNIEVQKKVEQELSK